MRSDKMIFYLLRNDCELNKNEIEEIIISVAKTRKSKIKKTINQLIKSGDIGEKSDQLRLMAKARRKMIKPDGRVNYSGLKWQRHWTMVLFDIPERNKKIRDILRYKLQKMGFGMMQGSVWVKPTDVNKEVRNFVRSRNLQWQVKVLSFSMAPSDEKETIHRIWRMEKLNEEYARFIKKTVDRFRKIKNYNYTNANLMPIALDLLSRLTEKEYLKLYKRDPQLPIGLLPKDWNGRRAYNIYRQLDKYLVR